MTDNTTLIAEARRFVQDTSDEFYENHLVRSLVGALDAAEQERDELAAVIERVRAEAEAWVTHTASRRGSSDG